jgi:hypothetical protein
VRLVSEHDLEDGKSTSLIIMISSGLRMAPVEGPNRPLQRVDVGTVGGENVRRVKREEGEASVRKLK